MIHRPSSLPALDQCAKFSGGSSEFAEEGTVRHAILATALKTNSTADIQFSAETNTDAEGITWAADYILLHAPSSDYPIEVEQTRSWLGPDFTVRTGTPDVVCGPVIFDFKWRWRDYTAQMADYALERFDAGFERVTVHLLFGAHRRYEIVEFTRESAERIVSGILAKAEAPDAQPTPCDYCGWCAHRLTCSAVLERVNAVVEGRVDWGLATYHSTEIATAEQMGKALEIARLVKKWADAVEYEAKRMVGRGDIPEGFKLQDRKGNRFISSVAEAFPRVGLSQEVFLKACEVGFSDLAKLYAEIHGMKKAAAERAVAELLGDVLQRKASSQRLVSDKSKIEEEE